MANPGGSLNSRTIRERAFQRHFQVKIPGQDYTISLILLFSGMPIEGITFPEIYPSKGFLFLEF